MKTIIPFNKRKRKSQGKEVFATATIGRDLSPNMYDLTENYVKAIIRLNIHNTRPVVAVYSEWENEHEVLEQINFEPRDKTELEEFLIRQFDRKFSSLYE